MQVRFLDPDLPNHYHFIVARIQVHNRIDGWWFGNNSLSVFRDGGFAHGQPTLYALFDQGQPGGGLVGDITGHGYVDLSVDDTSVCDLDFTPPVSVGQFRDRLRGIAATAQPTRLRGTLNGQADAIDLRVIEFHHLPGAPLSPTLTRVKDFFNASVSRAERHNILFLAEGFSADPATGDGARFAETVTKGTNDLFDAERHSPYRMVRSGFNVWTRFEPSVESGVTCGPPLSADGVPLLVNVASPATVPAGAYTLMQLIQFVGLPTPTEAALDFDDLMQRWAAPNSVPQQLGFEAARVAPGIVEIWKKQLPRHVQAVDTFYGAIRGIRPGDRLSKVEPRAQMVATPGANPTAADIMRLGRRMFTWYIPDLGADLAYPDPRRFAPEYGGRETVMLSGHVSRLADSDPSAAAGTPDHEVGRLWDITTPPDPNLTSRQVNSAGLVVFLLNGEFNGGVNYTNESPNLIFGRFVYVSLGSRTAYTPEVIASAPNVRRLRLTPLGRLISDHGASKVSVLSRTVDVLAHELAHSLNLSDEYEVAVSDDVGSKARIEVSDNLTVVTAVQNPQQAASLNPAFPAPVDPTRIKWLVPHRVERADILTNKSRVDITPAGERIVIQLAPGAAFKWLSAHQLREPVCLRQFKANRLDNRQLPLQISTPAHPFDDLYPDLIIEEIKGDTLTLSGAPANAIIFPAGSVLYIPRRNQAGVALHLIEAKVEEFMRTHSWNPADPNFPPGRALTENHNPAPNTGGSDPVPPPGPGTDNPPDIPGLKLPCKRFKVIGLYEGGGRFTTHVYRPAGACKMRYQYSDTEDEGEHEFCFVCKYLIVNRIDAGKLGDLDDQYPKKKGLSDVLTIFGGPLPINLGDIH